MKVIFCESKTSSYSYVINVLNKVDYFNIVQNFGLK